MRGRIRFSAAGFVLGVGLGVAGAASQEPPYEYTVPAETGDGWETASLADRSMDERLLVSLMNRLHRSAGNLIHGLLVVKGGALVFEEYFPGRDVDLSDPEILRGDTLNLVPVSFGREVLHHCASVTKSVTSQLFGIALGRGGIHDTDAPMFSFFPDYADLRSPAKDSITLHHMLSMTSGLPFDEESYPLTDPRNDARRLFLSKDPLAFMLAREPKSAPGSTYQYGSGTTVLLAEIIQRSTGTDLSAFAEEHLFRPLGISSYRWAPLQGDPDVPDGAGGLYLRPRDMAKLGQVMLQGGRWKGEEVLPADWVRRSVSPQITVPRRGSFRAYGYQWKLGLLGGHEAYWAAGWGGQYVVVFPDLDLVCVQTAGRYRGEHVPLDFEEILQAYVLPAATRN
jgi:CubicO group peptidase (beta-lactamase class C family)